MAIPLFEEGLLRGIKMRDIWKCEPHRRFFPMEGSRLVLFNYDHVYLRTGPVFVVKGEIPAMLMHQLGFPVCAPTAGEGSYKGQVQRWTGALALASKVIVGDNDEPGRGQEMPNESQAFQFLVSETGALADALVSSNGNCVWNNPGRERDIEAEAGDVLMTLYVTLMERGTDPLEAMLAKFMRRGFPIETKTEDTAFRGPADAHPSVHR